VAIAPDGSWLAIGGADGKLRIWDTATWQQRAVLADHLHGISAVAVAPDGNWLASGGADGELRIWDTATRQQQALMRVENSIHACTWLGTFGLAVGGWAGLYLFDFFAGTRDTLQTPEEPITQQPGATS
jgi:WD40 repeat protein